jgi:hemoglobin
MRSLNVSVVPVVVGALAIVAFLSPTVLGQSAAEMSLYDRLGGYGAISAVANDFAEKLFVDPQVGGFFKGMGTDTRRSFIQKNINLVCNVTGGPCKILSRPAKTVHAGLGITEADFEIVVNHLVDTLDAFKVPAKEKQELLSIVGTLKSDIVEG